MFYCRCVETSPVRERQDMYDCDIQNALDRYTQLWRLESIGKTSWRLMSMKVKVLEVKQVVDSGKCSDVVVMVFSLLC